ncbi:MAG TPA: restriction endonuclease [Limnochordia bacterium]|jgi:uncharacterized protein YwgA|nr:restriction endonuclease [Limnochordia bacterium]
MGMGGYPWERYGLIVELTGRIQDVSSQFGKTAMQKMVYLLQAVYEVEFGYNYNFYTYGPYSADLSRDLKIIEHHGGIEINYVNSETRGFRIKQGANHTQFAEKAASSIRRAKSKMDAAISEFGEYNARELELRSTIIYAERDLRENGESLSLNRFVELVYNLKPHFEPDYIVEVIGELEKKGFISINRRPIN